MPDNFFAVRGSRNLSREEFEAHLALAIRLENVAVLLGAGASTCVGGQIMADIWNVIEHDQSRDAAWLRDQHFVSQGTEPNIESVLDQLEIARRDADRRRATADRERLSQVLHHLRQAVVRAAILDEALWRRPDETIINTRFA